MTAGGLPHNMRRAPGDVERPDAHDEEADLEIARVPLDDAVSMALRGEIVNATAVSGILALAAARARGEDLRSADAAWVDRPDAFARRKHGRAGHGSA